LDQTEEDKKKAQEEVERFQEGVKKQMKGFKEAFEGVYHCNSDPDVSSQLKNWLKSEWPLLFDSTSPFSIPRLEEALQKKLGEYSQRFGEFKVIIDHLEDKIGEASYWLEKVNAAVLDLRVLAQKERKRLSRKKRGWFSWLKRT
jgi:hypothetical protein